MTCPFDRETLAAYVNDDLPAAIRRSTEEHLSRCTECRRVVEQYLEGRGALVRAVAATSLPAGFSQPLPARRPAWPGLAAAAAVVACLLLVFQIPAVAEQLHLIQVRFITLEQLEESIRAFHDRKPEYGPPAALDTLEEAAAKYRRPLAVPAYLPEGYKLKRVLTYGDGPVERVLQEYVLQEPNATLRIWQFPARDTQVISYLEGVEPIVVQVNGAEAYVAEHLIHVNGDGSYKIVNDRMRRMVFQWQGDIVEIHSTTTHYPRTIERLSVEELVKVAESLK